MTVPLVLCFGVTMSTRKSQTHTIVWISNTAFERLKLVLFATEHGSATSWFEQGIGTFSFSFTGDQEGKKRGGGGRGSIHCHSPSLKLWETKRSSTSSGFHRDPLKNDPEQWSAHVKHRHDSSSEGVSGSESRTYIYIYICPCSEYCTLPFAELLGLASGHTYIHSASTTVSDSQIRSSRIYITTKVFQVHLRNEGLRLGEQV